MPTCETCRFWLKTDYYRQGQCRRHAPVANVTIMMHGRGMDSDAPGPQWPRLLDDEWCGDHEPRLSGE